MKKIILGLCLLLPSVGAAAGPKSPGAAYTIYLKAMLLESRGDIAASREELEKAIVLAPTSAYLYKTMAELSLRLGQVSRAVDEIDKAIELDSEDAKSLTLAGQIHWALGQTDESERLLKKAVALDPDGAEAIISLAGSLAPKKPEEAIKLYKTFLDSHPGDVNIYERLAQLQQLNGDVESAKATWEKSLEWSPGSVRANLALAQIAEVQTDTTSAIVYYEKVLEGDPTNLPLLLRVGELRYRSNDFSKAYDAFAKAHSISPDSATANFWLALYSENNRDWEEAIRLLELVAAQGNDPAVMLRLAYYYSEAGRLKDSTKTLKKLSDLNPTNTDFLSYLAVSYEENRQFNLAEKALKKVIEIEPNDHEAHFHLAHVYDRMGKFLKSEEELKVAISLKPDYDVALNYLGYSYADRNMKLEEAETLIQNAIAFDPENAAYMDSLGWVYYRMKEFDKAIEFLSEAAAQAHDGVILDHLGDAYLGAGNISSAVSSWEEALRLAPDLKLTASKLNKAFKSLTAEQKFGHFSKRAVTAFANLESVHGVVKISVCDNTPCFKTKASFDFERANELKVEIPGPMAGPVMLLTKKPGVSAEFGAIHPVLLSVRYFITRAFNRMENVLTAEQFAKWGKPDPSPAVLEKGRFLESTYEGVTLRFDRKKGNLLEILYVGPDGEERLSLAPYNSLVDSEIPKIFEWKDLTKNFTVRLEFLNPAVSSLSPRLKASSPNGLPK